MAIFGRITARQRLRRATRESLSIPAFSSPVDCTPWVTGGLWPAELSADAPETAALADHLKDDLQRIADTTNDELKIIKRAGLSDEARYAEEARLIDEARARALRRVESTIRQLDEMKAVAAPSLSRAEPAEPPTPDLGSTQVLPAVAAAEEESALGRHHGPADDPAPDVGELEAPAVPAADEPSESEPLGVELDRDRLGRLLEFVVRQEPRLNWAVGDHPDGTTVLVTDLAYGWIPAGIALPAGVRLLAPERRSGKAAALIGDLARVATYSPGNSLRRSADFAATKSSSQPRELPLLDDLAWLLSETTQWREGLPRIVHRLARAAADEVAVVDQEVDVLRVQLDTARYQLLIQYPQVSPSLLLNCLLMAATEGMLSGDAIAANYHLSWYRTLAAADPQA